MSGEGSVPSVGVPKAGGCGLSFSARWPIMVSRAADTLSSCGELLPAPEWGVTGSVAVALSSSWARRS